MKKKVDSRIRTLVENGVRTKTRAFFVIVGDHGRDQVVNLHYMTTKLNGGAKKPSVLWCYKKELGFSSHRKKRAKQIKRQIRQGQHDPNVDDPFDLFISSTNIRYCYYKETEQVLGKTFGMCILQDFESLTPNLLCRTIETVEGGGLVIVLLKTMASLKQLYQLTMDAHNNYRTETHTDTEPRFNERFVLSLRDCSACLVLDDELNILPISAHAKTLKPVEGRDLADTLDVPKTAKERELDELKSTMAETQPIGPILSVAKTLDQARAVMTFIDAISEKTLSRTVALTAGRGRGKSAALGLAIASAIAYGYSNVFVTAPSPENLSTVFEFILKGFDALGLVEHQQYELVQADNPELNKALVRVNVFRDHRQTVQYINPSDYQHLAQAELLVIDEAAAIPLPTVKKLLGPYLVLISSTVNGYEGTGRALSLKLIEDLRKGKAVGRAGTERSLKEVHLDEPIRYAPGDGLEAWLSRLLCLDAAQVPPLRLSSLPMPSECRLFLVNRDALFSHHDASERFLFQIMSLFVSSHYKNTPNDLMLMADAPAHHILVMLPPFDASSEQQAELPEVLVAIQVCMEGALSQETVKASLRRGVRPSGDLIPWTLAQHFLNDNFAQLSGARIVRIATHPALHRKGYASQAVTQLAAWFEERCRGEASFQAESKSTKKKKGAPAESDGLLTEELAPREAPALLEAVTDIPPPYTLDYLGTSFGLTLELYEFWHKAGFRPVYMRQVKHEATGEHSSILLRHLVPLERPAAAASIVGHFGADFRQRFLRLLQGPFRSQPTRLALSIVDPPSEASASAASPGEDIRSSADCPESQAALTAASLLQFLSRDDVHRLEQYGRNLVDYALVLDIVPALATLFLGRRMPGVYLSQAQCAMLVAVGCQHRTFDEVAADLGAPTSQLLALFNKAMHKLSNYCRDVLVRQIEEEDESAVAAASGDGASRKPLKSGEVMSGGKFIKDSLQVEQEASAKKVNKALDAQRQELLTSLMKDEYSVVARTEDFEEALGGKAPTSGSVAIKRKGAGPAKEKENGAGKKQRK